MLTIANTLDRNLLLQALPESEMDRMRPKLEPVTLHVNDVLVEPDQEIQHVTFIQSGVVSIVVGNESDSEIEVGLMGRDGLVGLRIVLGSDRSRHRTFIQIAGAGLRMRADDFRQAFQSNPVLKAVVLRYVQAHMDQLAETALANGRYNVEARLARWLLMCHDRMDSDDVPLTHEFLALMLGVRRAGVTVALHVLEGEHMIRAQRAHIIIRDRAKLEAVAGGCYTPPPSGHGHGLTQGRPA